MTNKTQAEALKPCPFCGDDGEKESNGIMVSGEVVNDWIKCLVCNSTARWSVWNNRALSASQALSLAQRCKLVEDFEHAILAFAKLGTDETNECRKRASNALVAALSAPQALSEEQEREDELRAAARAVIDRWDTPLWKDAPATAVYINKLRRALDARSRLATRSGEGAV